MRRSCYLVLSAIALLGIASLRAQSLDEAARRAADDYAARLSTAAEELDRARARVAAEKIPLLEQMRQAEERILAAESELTRLETRREDFTEERRKLLLNLDGIRKTTTYVSTLAHEGFKGAVDGLAPGEDQVVGETVLALQGRLEGTSEQARGAAAIDVAEFLVAQTADALGGYRAAGSAMVGESNQVLPGMFAFVGPETFFRPENGGPAGAVRPREGAKYPVSYALPMWKPDDAARFFAGERGAMVADASGGKALRLKETTGTMWDHIRKGGVVAFAILGVGMFAVLMIIQKVRDLAHMGMDTPATVKIALDHLARGQTGEAERAIQALKRATRELFTDGMRHRDLPKAILEERLMAVLLAQRLRYERRLPLLAVIATAAPLMGLLGTVVGMVKTFALITVFGTGNAAKLSTGISEVLVATELGLAVAIPTLVAHGFLAHRIQKNLSLLERYALQFTTAVELARIAPDREPAKESVVA